MPKLPVLQSRHIIKVVENIGFQFQRQNGSHRIYVHPVNGNVVVVPVHAGKDIPPATLKSILKQAGLTVEELVQNLK